MSAVYVIVFLAMVVLFCCHPVRLWWGSDATYRKRARYHRMLTLAVQVEAMVTGDTQPRAILLDQIERPNTSPNELLDEYLELLRVDEPTATRQTAVQSINRVNLARLCFK